MKIEEKPCLILDERLINVFKDQQFRDFEALSKIRTTNAARNYLAYLKVMEKLAKNFDTNAENIEQFLFLFGNNLKAKDTSPKYS